MELVVSPLTYMYYSVVWIITTHVLIDCRKLLEMSCKLKFDILLLTDEKPLTYVYWIQPSSSQSEENTMEYFHHISSHGTTAVNRCLVIPTDKCNPEGE